jgi:chitinase
VLFEGRVFEAKWWTQTDSPEAALQGSPESPWSKLRDEELMKIMAKATAAPVPSAAASAPAP